MREQGLLEETLVVFASDNGSYRLDSNRPLRAVKSYVYEGGIRVPGIFTWPERFPTGAEFEQPAGLVDVLPTICDLVGVDYPSGRDLDGTSILPLFEGGEIVRDRPLYWFFYRTTPEIAMRVGGPHHFG